MLLISELIADVKFQFSTSTKKFNTRKSELNLIFSFISEIQFLEKKNFQLKNSNSFSKLLRKTKSSGGLITDTKSICILTKSYGNPLYNFYPHCPFKLVKVCTMLLLCSFKPRTFRNFFSVCWRGFNNFSKRLFIVCSKRLINISSLNFALKWFFLY